MTNEVIPAITIDEVRAALPSKKNAITHEVVDIINRSMTEPEFQGESLLQSAITYEKVLGNRAGVGIKDYLNAIRFCAYLMSVDDNITEAYKKTFADRSFVKERMNAPTDSVEYRELTSSASRYRSSKIVVDILTYSQVPLDLMFTGQRYKALGVLATEMVTAKFSKDRISAAKELLAATKGPDNMKISLDVGTSESSAVDRLTEQLNIIAAKQKAMLESGTTDLSAIGAIVIEHDDEVKRE